MNAIDLWLVISAVLLAIATIVAVFPDRLAAARATATGFIASGLLAFVIAALVARN